MHRIGIAFRAFFKILGSMAIAEQVARILKGERLAEISEKKPEPKPAAPRETPKKQPLRNDALNLLSALQREARFVDFIKEPIAGYSDAQVGAAVRDIHRECASLIERVFAVRPLLPGEEGAEVEVPDGFVATRYRLVGNVTGQAPFRGKLQHHGWEATRCELPEWTGDEKAAWIVAPAEVELR